MLHPDSFHRIVFQQQRTIAGNQNCPLGQAREPATPEGQRAAHDARTGAAARLVRGRRRHLVHVPEHNLGQLDHVHGRRRHRRGRGRPHQGGEGAADRARAPGAGARDGPGAVPVQPLDVAPAQLRPRQGQLAGDEGRLRAEQWPAVWSDVRTPATLCHPSPQER